MSKIIVSLLAILITAGAAEAQSPGLRGHTLQHDGLKRQYLLYTPKGAKDLEGDRPLVVVLHGGGARHRSMLALTKRKFHELANQDGFYVVYPNAVDQFWDFGEGTVSDDLPSPVDDLGFFFALLDELISERAIDAHRVFATGISRGGQASYFLACNLSERIRAIAAFAMPLPRFMKNECRKGAPVGVAVLNGTTDPFVPFDGGKIDVLGGERDRVLSTSATVRVLRKRNGCGASGDETALPDIADDGTTVTVTAWSKKCEAPVMLYRIEGGGHTWPSGIQYLPESVIGAVSQEVDGAVEAWGFFSSFE